MPSNENSFTYSSSSPYAQSLAYRVLLTRKQANDLLLVDFWVKTQDPRHYPIELLLR